MSIWEKAEIIRDNGEPVIAIAPIIISASRSTDIPGCYADWFMNRIKKGYVAWINPFNRVPSFISFKNVRVIIFWTKNPSPIIPHLYELDNKNIHYYFQFTLNDYSSEKIECGIPDLSNRISAFQELSRLIGRERVIWRYDPLFLSNNIHIDDLITRIHHIGTQIHEFTFKLVFSFIDILEYKKVRSSLDDSSIREFTSEEMIEFAEKLAQINKLWGLELSTCAESINLSSLGIQHNKCIDGDLMSYLFPDDLDLNLFLRKNAKKDKGQRESCGCIISKDIGQYNTCYHQCKYCYANRSETEVLYNFEQSKLNPNSETINGLSINVSSKYEDTTKKSSQLTLF
jgi:DNA repair photolyase